MQAMIVELDIAKGRIHSPGMPSMTPSSSCYACLWNNDCIDNDTNGDVNKECTDFGTTAMPAGGAGAGMSEATLCTNAFVCQFAGGAGAGCPFSMASDPSYCYCGAGGGPLAMCSAAMNTAVNGPCEHAIALGYAFPEFDSKDILSSYDSVTTPSGRANQVFECIISNDKHGGCIGLCQ
jgi:hypothetical protein